MTDEYRDIAWRQGAVFTYSNLAGPSRMGVIASHDCDLCADLEIEDVIEYVPFGLIDALNGSMTLGKNARRLHVEILDDNLQRKIAELDIRKRAIIRKDDFVQDAKPYPYQLATQDLVVFRRWLSARYARSAFANSFEVQMDRVRKSIDRLAKTHGTGIRAMYFDVDDNQLIERSEADEPYALAIYAVYPPATPDNEAAEFATRLEQIFTKAFYDPATKLWAGIEITGCDAVAEDVFPLALALSTKPWRVDHRSYSGQQATSLYPDQGS
ncbi:MAG TPA: hypothetical protein VGU65_10005 [Frateuria sp.]|uniref:hypothetical protein n=1 Tax=Frateuria sp. TaxID=2211372 RepID=UPI002DF3CCDD|nr:hypothetical protein [Frateuria sp.]